MRSFTTKIDEKNFNLIWRSLSDREEKLQQIVAEHQEDDCSEIGPMAANDLVYLRLYKKHLKTLAEQAVFDAGCFSLDDGIIDISKL
ncbi:MAG: hypothetical protein K0U59_02940 [Gammaproteobacteria bacterium]|nr:hypothetical protein [Gammaproteobacteria bacterium]